MTVSLVDPDFDADGQDSAVITSATKMKFCLAPAIGLPVASPNPGFCHNLSVPSMKDKMERLDYKRLSSEFPVNGGAHRFDSRACFIVTHERPDRRQ